MCVHHLLNDGDDRDTYVSIRTFTTHSSSTTHFFVVYFAGQSFEMGEIIYIRITWARVCAREGGFSIA